MVDEVRRGAPHLEPEELARIFSVEEFEPLARERMPAEGYNFIAGAAGTGDGGSRATSRRTRAGGSGSAGSSTSATSTPP